MPRWKQYSVSLVLVVLGSASIACQRAEPAGEGSLPAHAPGDAPYERFGAQLFASLATHRGRDSNTVISPLSAGIALSLVAGGAGGATYDSLVRALGVGRLDPAALARRDSRLLASLSSRSDVTLEIANAVWVSPRFSLQATYVSKGANQYRSLVSTVALNSAEGANTINEWAKEKTHGKIASIVGGPALFVILPDSGVPIEDVESRLAQSGLPSGKADYALRDVRLRLPRVHTEVSVDLAPPLTMLGAAIAFDCKQADFRAMLVLAGDQHACIDRAMQKVFIDVDEKGTEAAAVTTVEITRDSAAGPPPPIQFIVDRPFLFVLRDEPSGVPLFMGRIVHPGTSVKTVR